MIGVDLSSMDANLVIFVLFFAFFSLLPDKPTSFRADGRARGSEHPGDDLRSEEPPPCVLPLLAEEQNHEVGGGAFLPPLKVKQERVLQLGGLSLLSRTTLVIFFFVPIS